MLRRVPRFIIRDEFRSGSFRRFSTVGLFHFRREVCRRDSGRGGEIACLLGLLSPSHWESELLSAGSQCYHVFSVGSIVSVTNVLFIQAACLVLSVCLL